MTPEQYIQKLIELSSRKLEGIKEILVLTNQQAANITEDNLEELQKVIDLKQQQMDTIDEIDAAFEVYYSRLKSTLGVQSLEEVKMTDLNGAAELKQMVTTIYNITKEIQQVEKQNHDRANKLLDHLGQEIRRVNQSKMVNRGYNIGGNLPQQSYFIDKKK